MTEITANTDNNESRKVHLGPFLLALIVAPILVGLPALMLVILGAATGGLLIGFTMIALFPAVATFVGMPTYFLFGAPAFWMALRRGIPVPAMAFLANLVSLPFVAAYFNATGGDATAALGFFGLLGSLFAMIWGAVFANLYAHFSGEPIE